MIGFYWLRHTFLTIAEETKDFEAARAVMGHIDARVTGQYRSMVSDERLIAVSDYVRDWLSDTPNAITPIQLPPSA
jgi:integrase